jgi:hypothetical protein
MKREIRVVSGRKAAKPFEDESRVGAGQMALNQ